MPIKSKVSVKTVEEVVIEDGYYKNDDYDHYRVMENQTLKLSVFNSSEVFHMKIIDNKEGNFENLSPSTPEEFNNALNKCNSLFAKFVTLNEQ